jgi:hypothetical protein
VPLSVCSSQAKGLPTILAAFLGPFHSKIEKVTLVSEHMYALLRFYSYKVQSEGAIVGG